MTIMQHSVTIDRPIDEVWAFVADVANNPVWQTNTVEVRRGGGNPLAAGDEFELVMKFLGKHLTMTFVTTEMTPPTRSAIRAISGPVPMLGTYDLEAVEGGTRFTAAAETDAHGWFKLAEPVFARMARRDPEASCGHLEDVLEAAAVPVPAVAP